MSERELPRDFVARRSDGVAEVLIDDEIVLYHEPLQTVHVLNPPAALVWSTLDGEATIEEIASALAGRFAIDATVMLADVTSIVAGFGQRGLLQQVPPDPDVVAAAKLPGTPRNSDREPSESSPDTEATRGNSNPRYRAVPPNR